MFKIIYLSFILFNLFNNNLYSANKDYYNYSETSRKLKNDPALDGINDNEELNVSMDVLSFIPGSNVLARPIAYLIQAGVVSVVSTEGSPDADGITEIITTLGNIVDIINISTTEGLSAISLQQIYKTNLYCQHQLVYVEENEYVSRQKSTPGGGYPVFPVYPMDIPIENNQCSLNDNVIEKYFIKEDLEPIDSKCAYSYSATRDQCIVELTVPIYSEYLAQQSIVEVVCLKSALKNLGKAAKEAAEKAAKEAAEKAAKEAAEKVMKEVGEEVADDVAKEMAEKAAKEAAEKASKEAAEKTAKKYKSKEIIEVTATIATIATKTGIELFFDPKLAYEPILMSALLQIEFTLDFMINLAIDILSGDGACLIAKIISVSTLDYVIKSTIAITNAIKYDDAKDALKNITFCGYNWLSYRPTEDGKYYEKGMFDNSRYKAVSDCINTNNCSLSNSEACDSINNESNWCNKIQANTKNIKNKFFREYTYGGKEYVANKAENDVKNIEDNRQGSIEYEPDYCIDPRLPEYKGFRSVAQRYYMKGNEKANFACSRFFYNSNDGCILPEKDIGNEDKRNLKSFQENGTKYYIIDKNSGKLDKYSIKCKNAFTEARKCCKYRSRHFVCLENKSSHNSKFCFSNVVHKYGTDAVEKTNLFNYIASRDTDAEKITCEIDDYKFEASKKSGTDHICVFSDNLCPYNFKLNAGLNYRASYCDADYFTDYKDKSGVLQREATQYNAADCKEGLFSAKMREKYKELHTAGKTFSAYTYKKVMQDMKSFNYNDKDFETIYGFDLPISEESNVTKFNNINTLDGVGKNYTNEQLNYIRKQGFSNIDGNITMYDLPYAYAERLKTSAYGQIKNFCQYRAHCVEVDKEAEYPEDFSITALFLDSSCNGSSSNSRNILQTDRGGIPRQLSVPIVECVYESLKNLVNGIAGISSCAEGVDLNEDGYCEFDTKEDVEYNLKHSNTKFFEGKYNKVNDVYMIKGIELPADYNPFLKIQKYFVNIIKITLCLFLVVSSYKKLIVGDYNIFEKDFISKHMPNLVLQTSKFSLVAYLVFSNGWRNGIYDYIVNFSTATYDFVNRLFVKVVKNPKNQILEINNGSGKIIKIVQVDGATNTETDTFICYRYDMFNNIDFKIKNDLLGRCDNGYRKKPLTEILVTKNNNFPKQTNACRQIISNNQEISKLLYYIDQYNKKNTNKLKIKITNTNDIDSLLNKNINQCTSLSSSTWTDLETTGGLWNKDYDGCYFDTTEYEYSKSYLSFFDTLDCKMIRYLGYSTDSAVPNLLIYSAVMLLPQLIFPNSNSAISKIVGGLGSMIFGLMMTFMFMMFNVLLKAVYLFTSSFFILSILIFLSPIILPMMFFDKTKSYYEKWFEYILGTVIKPSFGLALLILYVNLMDIVLIGDGVEFNKHSKIGRGPNVECLEGTLSFFCLVNQNITTTIGTILPLIFSEHLFDLLVNIVIVFLFFKLSDSFLDDLNNIIENIFKIGSASKLSGKDSIQQDKINDSVNQAMSTGKKLGDEFRQNYIGNVALGIAGNISNNVDSIAQKVATIRSNFNEYKLNKAQKNGRGYLSFYKDANGKRGFGFVGGINRQEEKLNNINNRIATLKQEIEIADTQANTLSSNGQQTDGISQGNIMREKQEELDKLQKEKEKTEQKLQERRDRTEPRIARRKDRLGIGDGKSGAGNIAQQMNNFLNRGFRLEKFENKFVGFFKNNNNVWLNTQKEKLKNKFKHKNKLTNNKLARGIYNLGSNLFGENGEARLLKKENEKLQDKKAWFFKHLLNRDGINKLEEDVINLNKKILDLEKEIEASGQSKISNIKKFIYEKQLEHRQKGINDKKAQYIDNIDEAEYYERENTKWNIEHGAKIDDNSNTVNRDGDN
ncbi:MAG: type IV secretion system protein [Rickettsiales bacterium]|nr:type IV secretion system protein [Rickettsiales bacterium]